MEQFTVSDNLLEQTDMLLMEEDEDLDDYFLDGNEQMMENEHNAEFTIARSQSEELFHEISDSYESESSCENEMYPTDKEEFMTKSSYIDNVQTFRLRKRLNQLDNIHKEKELMIQKIREELTACRERIQTLKQEKFNAEREILEEQKTNNVAAVSRLQAFQNRLFKELDNEEVVASTLATMLKENEFDLWQIEVEHGKFDSLRERLEKNEEELERQEKERATLRAEKEKISLTLTERKKQKEQLRETKRLKEQEVHYRKVMEDAQKNHVTAVQFLKETMTRVRELESKKEMRSREEMERRMQSVLSLKNSISTNRENMRVIEARNKAEAMKAKKQEIVEKEAVLNRGEDVTKFIIHQKRRKEFEKKKQEFEEQQRTRKQEIISRILKEESIQEKQKQQLSSLDLSKGHRSSKLRAKTMQYIKSVVYTEPEEEKDHQGNWRSPSPLSVSSDEETSSSSIGEKYPDVPPGLTYSTEEEDAESLAQPEFVGLWSEDYKPYKVPKEEPDMNQQGGSKMEKQIMAERLQKLRSGIIEKQVVSGHEFKGCPFHSKPNLVHFKDLDVGKIYRKRITLTNASYAINFCKLVGVSEHLKDFIAIQFDPPGPMSAGMSCEMVVIFKPMINEDLEGEVNLLAQTGPFCIPVKCTTKKCELALEKEHIDFGTHVVGETVIQAIALTNRGALGTKFSIHSLIHDSNTRDAEAAHIPYMTEIVSASPPLHEETDTFLVSTEQDHSGIQQTEAQKREEHHESSQSKEKSSLTATNKATEEHIKEPDAASAIEGDVLEVYSEEGVTEIKLGEMTEGEIGPLSTVKIPIIFTPMIPGKSIAQFEITFGNASCKAIHVLVTGAAIDVPVYLPNSNIDLKICTYDRLYQDSIMVHNRARTALRLKFEVCKELKNHMELLPKTGFIQAQSSFSVQLKFLPRLSLQEDASTCFDKDTGVLEAPMTISVADQTRPVPFTVHAIVTSSDLEISPAEVDFGYCTIVEAVQASLQLTNKSILPQEFGFVGIPEYVEIQPNDGFGTLLPLETVKLDVIFRAEKAKEYKFELTCKSAINRQFKVSCKAIGVHPPLALSHSLIQFPATALNDVSMATLHVINSHTSRNEFTHPVPRIGKGDIAPIGPTSFEFHVPEDYPITISPAVGTVLPGQRCKIQVSFQPLLSQNEIREEAIWIIHRAAEAKTTMETEAKLMMEKEIQDKKEKKIMSGKKEKKTLPSPKQQLKEKVPQLMHSVSTELPKTEDLKVNSDEYAAGRVSIYRRFMGKFERYVIPCFIANGDTSKSKDENFQFSHHNTLYLELHCPAIAPPIIITSENGRHLIDFGEIAIGQRVVKRVTLQNISLEPVELSVSLLNPCGPFMLLNPVSMVEPGGNCHLLIAFLPDENKIFFENMKVSCRQAALSLCIKGRGLTPSVSCSLEGGTLDMGYVLANDSNITTFKLQNTSTVPVTYSVKLSSLSESRYTELQKLPHFIASHERPAGLVGTQNYNGFSVFSVYPVEGTILPEKTQDLTVTFSPDHESIHYSDVLMVELFGKLIAHTIRLTGACRNHIMYVEGGEPLDVPVESLSTVPMEEEDSSDLVKSVLLNLHCFQTETAFKPGVRELHVGCIRTSSLPTKKSAEFFWENMQILQQKGFSIEPAKAMVEPGQRKSISIQWTPPAGYDPMTPARTTAKLTLKGDITEQYRVILATQVVQA
ncbi:cilia- and flagella-associated protein 74 [Xenopus laevis]|uniref:Cilia- and flagella-associated protein 74 n=2 Tax=Xenopus laevis TaxID=8355 RepID=A0A974HC89_XENLA|nr:cilia- and flagella-associated protein 74 [Xenopus laevis]OCT72634.1 hypothetical protein XELAEV_18035616mg [Xenopus laevis]